MPPKPRSSEIRAKVGLVPARSGRPDDIRALVKKHRDEVAEAEAVASKLNGHVGEKSPEELKAEARLHKLQQIVIEMYTVGHGRRVIATYIAKHIKPLRPEYRPDDWVHIKRVIRIIKEWEDDPLFRDRLWSSVQKHLDMQTPAITNGVVKAAKRGRVDAAKFAMELSGRYQPRGDEKPAVVNISFGALPRPVDDWRADIEGEAEEVDDD